MRHPSDAPRRTASSDLAIGVLGIAAAWMLLYELNRWLFGSTAVTSNVSWVFLPAALRMLAVLLLEWAGVFGLLLGNLAVTWMYFDQGKGDMLIQSTLSSIAPMLAYLAVRRWYNLPRELSGLTYRHLLVLSIAGGISSSILHQGYFHLSGRCGTQLVDAIPMFAGDVAGTLIVLYTASLVIRALARPVR